MAITPRCSAFLASATVLASGAAADVVILTPSKDNTLIQVDQGRLSNALGSLFTGVTAGGSIRHAVMAFPIQQIPAGAVITRVDLTIRVTRTTAGPAPFEMHRLTTDWGEGSSNSGTQGQGTPSTPGDATWLHTFYSTQFWTNPGGDYDSLVSAATTLDQVGSYTFQSTPALVADVQRWVDTPAQNFGWLMKATEEVVFHTAKRFASREATSTQRPSLRIEYTIPAPGTLALLGLAPLAARRRRV